MNNSSWATKEEFQKQLEKVNLKTSIEKSGIPIMYDDEYLYVDTKGGHNLIIGSTGSGKTQSIILPMLKFAMMTKESLLVTDGDGTIYQRMAKKLKEENYKVIAINMDDPKLGDSWNPLDLPYKLYQENQYDKALEIIEEIGYYLFYSKMENTDPFWINTTINYFAGLVLYLFENASKEEINLSSVGSLANDLNEKGASAKFLEKLPKDSNILLKVSATLKAPSETRGSILSVFNDKFEKYLSKKDLENMLSASNFDITNIPKEKTAIFLIYGMNSNSSNLIPLFTNQIMDTISIYSNREKRFNILLDEFDSLIPIKDFARKLNYSRTLNIRITATIQSYIHLLNIYSKEETEILKMCFGNIIYLISEDIYTLEEISKNCGTYIENGKEIPLITVSELKTMKSFEAIILMVRMLPFKTKLLPDYQIDWGYTTEEETIKKRNHKEIAVFSLEKEKME